MTHNLNAAPFMASSVGAHLGGQIMALDFERGHLLLSEAWPDRSTDPAAGPVMAGGPVEIRRGERFAVSRRVAVMPIRGILTPDSEVLERYFGWATYQGIEAACAEIAANEDVSAAVLDVNSPGGMVMGLEGAAQAVAALAAIKPVHVLVNPMAASAAYFIASQASDITMIPGSELGSIGTMRSSVWPVKPDNWGDQWGVHLSSHARAKNPNPTSETGLAEIQRSLDEAEAAFLDAVATGRGLDRAGLPKHLSVTDDEADGGAMYRTDQALARNLADGVETRAAFYERVLSAYASQPGATGARALSASARARLALAISNT